MQIHFNLNELPAFYKAAITIGTFDGVHRGHGEVIQQLKDIAKMAGGETVIITFHPHPRKIIKDQLAAVSLLNTMDEKIKLLGQAGIDHLVITPFTQDFADLEPEVYVENFLIKHFNPAHIVIGYDHHFGKKRKGDFQLLEKLAPQFNFQVHEIKASVVDDITISSTLIRKFLLNGDVAQANQLLGYTYFFSGEVVEGNRLGRTIGYPTANLQINSLEKLQPAHGVYAVWCTLPNHTEKIGGMMNIGVRPTVQGTRETVEVNLFNFDQEIYGKTLEVHVVAWLRGEQKFSGLDSLKSQLALDQIAARKLLTSVMDESL